MRSRRSTGNLSRGDSRSGDAPAHDDQQGRLRQGRRVSDEARPDARGAGTNARKGKDRTGWRGRAGTALWSRCCRTVGGGRTRQRALGSGGGAGEGSHRPIWQAQETESEVVTRQRSTLSRTDYEK